MNSQLGISSQATCRCCTATSRLRRQVEQLPILDASEQSLDNRDLLRACALLAIVAHAYWYVEPKPVETLPAAIQAPWQQLRARLGRSQEVLTYTDLVVYNWRLRSPAADASAPLRVEDLALLLPTIGNREESVFYLTQLEILSRASSMVRAFVNAHEAVLRQDEAGVERALVEIIDGMDRVLSESLLKLSPNPYSPTFVDPVVWAKTVARSRFQFTRAIKARAAPHRRSSTRSTFSSGAAQNATFLGREIRQLRETTIRPSGGNSWTRFRVSRWSISCTPLRSPACAARCAKRWICTPASTASSAVTA